jgi:nucleoid-associated protein YgaU
MEDPLKVLFEGALQTSRFPATSRYAGIETATYEKADGATVVYVKRRFLPQGDDFSVVHEHVVTAGERLDNIAAQYLGDPEQFWRICDANNAVQPEALVSEPGKRINITLPEDMPG